MSFASGTRARTYSISKADMEASKLVFVFVRDAKPKRKVAVPVPDGFSWDDFLKQVKQKLKITGVKEVTLVSTGQKVSSLDELQDIDELCVTEGVEAARSVAINAQGSLPNGADGTAEITAHTSERPIPLSPERVKSTTSKAHATASNSSHIPDSDDMKYSRRTHSAKRALQKWLPWLFTPTLPVSTRDAALADSTEITDMVRAGSKGMKRKLRRGGLLSTRNILLLLAVATCVLTMLWLSARLTGKGIET